MKLLYALLPGLLFSAFAISGELPSPENARVYIVNLQDGQKVNSPFKVVFGLSGMGVAPAGVDNKIFKNIGHHHLFINSPLKNENLTGSIPFDEQHLHFGKGQTETVLNLPEGSYTLRLVLGDPYHIPHNPVVASDEITIYVKKGASHEH